MWTKIKDEIVNNLIKVLPKIPFLVIVWSIGFYTLRQSAIQFNLDSPEKIHNYHLLFLGVAFFFILMPFVRTIKIGQFLEMERKIDEAKQEVKDFKTEVRQMITMVSNTISNSNTTNNYYVNESKVQTAKAKFVDKASESDLDFKVKVQKGKDELILENEDLMLALARTRMRLEVTLRNLLDKETTFPNQKTHIKYLTLNSLYNLFIEQHPDYEYSRQAFRYVQNICNAAIHGQRIDESVANDALEMGAGLIEQFRKISEG